LSAVVGLEAERVRLYVDLALSSLSEVARAALEALMRSGNYQYQSEFAQKYVAQGREEGREEGRQEGRQEGEMAALFEVLDARGLVVDEEARRRILACTETAQLKLWSVSRPTARKASKPGRNSQARKPRSR
jgi:predicted transposase YdaD